ncbi:MAG: phosphatase PAP2 family protein [Mesorhizobium sp.]|uniref:phosphatase PAP2 family protein n=1 Tax=Mesorhizobium sp. TaxID=1871066 RepID=UPI000FE47EC4|nr:phosphatase PAP2 family protein [Mesorhizobium sp.]RWF44312.1 MAG: phosphatase PAP2 family protein [Mesorhizobium sp.]
MGSVRRLILLSLSLTLLVAAASYLWLPYSNVYIDPSNASLVAKVFAGVVGLYGIVALVAWRVRGDGSQLGRLIGGLAGMAQSLLKLSAVLIPFGCSFAVFICLASATSKPLIDAHLAAIDHAIGFDWLAFLDLTNRSPTISAILVAVYHSAGYQMLLLILLHASMQRLDRLFEFSVTCTLCLTITGAIVAFFPAEGAYAYFQPLPTMFSNFTTDAGMWHYPTLLKLRAGEPFAVMLSEAQPLVTFPSFHTSIGVLIAYSVRFWRFVCWPAVALETIMIVSTLPEGGHHLIDLIAGVGVAAVSIFGVRSALAYQPAVSLGWAAQQRSGGQHVECLEKDHD